MERNNYYCKWFWFLLKLYNHHICTASKSLCLYDSAVSSPVPALDFVRIFTMSLNTAETGESGIVAT